MSQKGLKRKENLEKFYKEKIQKLDFFSKKPVNPMMHRFLINKMLYKLYDEGPLHPKNLIDTVYAENFEHKKPEWLINGTYFPFAKFFNLVEKDDQDRIFLTELGEKYVEADKNRLSDITEPQAKVIRDWIINNPFKTKIINGIYNFVETVLEILRNNGNVSFNNFTDYFALKSGKFFEWKEEDTKKTQFNNYYNFCKELGLIDIINDKFYITPISYKFIIQLQINRVREMISLI